LFRDLSVLTDRNLVVTVDSAKEYRRSQERTEEGISPMQKGSSKRRESAGFPAAVDFNQEEGDGRDRC
jgi:hypothetical protein